MKRIFLLLLLGLSIFFPLSLKAATWKVATPEGYTPITWAKASGISSFMKAPEGNGHIDFLTFIYLPYNQIKLIASSTPKLDWGPGKPPFDTTPNVHNWSFAKTNSEKTKQYTPAAAFVWNAPFFNYTIPSSDVSLSLKSTETTSTYLTSGSRPDSDVTQKRKMLLIDNKTSTAEISDFDEARFVNYGDEGVEGFAATETWKGTDTDTARLFLGVKPGGKELVVYCSQGASPLEASQALETAGIPIENQLQADGGTSATCGYNLPGQYFVEPGRTLTHLMGAFPFTARGSITTDKLNVRTGPGTTYSVARQLRRGSIVTAVEEKNGWYRVSAGQEWITKQYFKAE
jgi:rhodanese-related sulfurtransferase